MIKNMYVVLLFGILFGIVLAMPFNGGDHVIVSGDGGGGDCCNPFNQSLNTTDDVDFNTVDALDGYYLDGNLVLDIYATGRSIFIGEESHVVNDTVFIGYKSGEDSTGDDSVGIGLFALEDNTGGGCNAIGENALKNNEGIGCNAVGYYAGYSNDENYCNLFGRYAGRENTGSGYYLNAFGYYAGYRNEKGNCNFFGYRAGIYNKGTSSVGIGTNALDTNGKDYATAVGHYAGRLNSGTTSTMIGGYAGQDNTGSRLSCLGYQAGKGNTGSYVDAFGYRAGYENADDLNTFIGSNSGEGASGKDNACLGYKSGKDTDSDYCTFIGIMSGQNSGSLGFNSVGLGYYSLVGCNNNWVVSLGAYSGSGNTGNKTTSVGSYSSNSNTGDECTGIGYKSLYSNSGDRCIGIGYESLMDNTNDDYFSVGNTDDILMIGNMSTGHLTINGSIVNENYTLDVEGDIECESLDEVSDMRAKTFISGLGKNKVKSFCENVTIWGFVWNEYGYNYVNRSYNSSYFLHNYSYFDEELNETVDVMDEIFEQHNYTVATDLWFGEPTDEFDIGIPAQLLFNYVKNTFGEEFAHAIVYVPENESVELWNVNYKSVSMIFARYSQIIANELKQLEDRVDAMEEFLMQYGYVPPE